MAPGDPGPAVSSPAMAPNESNPADEAFTIERRGDLTVITATEELEHIEFGLEEPVSDLILKPLRRQEQPLIVFDLSRVNYFGSMFLALLIRCWKLAVSRGGTHGPLRGRRTIARAAADHVARHGLADLSIEAGSDRGPATGLSRPVRSVPPRPGTPRAAPPDRPVPGDVQPASRVAAHAIRPHPPLTGSTASLMMEERRGTADPNGRGAIRRRTEGESRPAGAEPPWASTTASIIRGESSGTGLFSGVTPVTKSIIVDQRRHLPAPEPPARWDQSNGTHAGSGWPPRPSTPSATSASASS